MLLWVVVKRTQLTTLVYERNQAANISMSVIKAGMSRTTARKYLRQDNVMEQRQAPHNWRTRKDPLEEVWPKAQAMLSEAPELEAKALFEYLAQSDPGGIKDELLRPSARPWANWSCRALRATPPSRRLRCPSQVPSRSWSSVCSASSPAAVASANAGLVHLLPQRRRRGVASLFVRRGELNHSFFKPTHSLQPTKESLQPTKRFLRLTKRAD